MKYEEIEKFRDIPTTSDLKIWIKLTDGIVAIGYFDIDNDLSDENKWNFYVRSSRKMDKVKSGKNIIAGEDIKEIGIFFNESQIKKEDIMIIHSFLTSEQIISSTDFTW